MRILPLLVLLPFLIVACSNETPAITKIESTEEYSAKEPELIEKELEANNEDEKVEMLLEFSLPNEQVIINLDQVTILRQYLASVRNKSYVINKMRLSSLEIPNYDTLYLLQFSCNEDTCSYLLLDQKNEGRSFLLEDLAKLKKVIPSPDNEKLLFTFARVQPDTKAILNKILVIDLMDWKVINLEIHSEDTETNKDYFNDVSMENGKLIDVSSYQAGIEDVTWKDNNSILITTSIIEEINRLDNEETDSNRNTSSIEMQLIN